jgi:hypothetical protein
MTEEERQKKIQKYRKEIRYMTESDFEIMMNTLVLKGKDRTEEDELLCEAIKLETDFVCREWE